MKIQDYTYLVNNPSVISVAQTSELESVINSFPYFQSARALHLKGLKSQDSYKYNQALKTTAAYTSDRSILFDFITSTKFQNNTLITEEQTILENIEVIDAEIVKALHQKITQTHSEETTKEPDEVLEIGKPLNFNSNESHSFGEWLQLGSLKPINRAEKKEKSTSKFDLIDKFIASNPKIKPVNKEAKPPIIKQESTDYDSLMTETLAQVYIEQKKYENAIKAYRILSLKYPEKSSFFANRIKAIKLLDKK